MPQLKPKKIGRPTLPEGAAKGQIVPVAVYKDGAISAFGK